MGERAGSPHDASVAPVEEHHAMAEKKPLRARISGVKAFFDHEAPAASFCSRRCSASSS